MPLDKEKKRKLRNILKAISPEDRPDIVVQELKEKVEEVISKIEIPEDGRDGKDADEEKIIKKVLAQIPKPKDGEKGEPGKDAEVDVTKLKTEIKRDILSILPPPVPHGGGNMNRQILANSSVLSQSFGDLNLLGSGVTLTAADDNTNKRVNLTFTSSPPAIGGGISGGTEGSVLFVGSGSVFAQDNANLFFDDTSNELGVGTNNPTGKLHVNGTLGSDVIVNGTFATDSDWSKGAGWTITGGQAVATATTANLTQSPSTTATRTLYKITHTSTVTSGTYRIIVGGQTLNTISVGGTYTTYVWTTTAGGLAFDGVSTFTGTIDDVSMYEITDTAVLDNAFFSSTNGPVLFSTNNQNTNHTAAVFMRDTGGATGAMPNIGIGIAEPKFTTGFNGMHLLGGENQSVELRLETTDTNRTTQIVFSNAKVDKWTIKNTATSNKFSILDNADNSAGIFNIVTNGYIGINEADPLAGLEVNAESATDVVLIAQGAPSQSANLQEWQDSNAVVLASVSSAGVFSGPGSSGTANERFGAGAAVTGDNSIALGNSASVGGSRSVGIGKDVVTGSAADNVVIGYNAGNDTASGASNVIIGSGATVSAAGAANVVVIGAGASAATSSVIVIGKDATTSSSSSIVIGIGAVVGNDGVSIGHGSSGSTDSTTIGQDATTVLRGVAIGEEADASFTESIAIGMKATTTAINQLVIGSPTEQIETVFIAGGVTHTAPTSVVFNATGGSGTDIAGGNITIAGGRGTGSGLGGSIIFQTTPAGASGTSLRTLTTRASIDSVGTFTSQNHEPITDDTYYLGRNDDDSPKAWKGVILKDTTDGKYYRIEVINGVITATDLTD